MSLADQFRDDVTNILLNQQDFAEQIIYRPGGDCAQEVLITALVQRGPLLIRGVDQGNTARWEMSVWVRQVDVPTLVKRSDVFLIPPRRGDERMAYMASVDLTPPHVPHLQRWGLIASRS